MHFPLAFIRESHIHMHMGATTQRQLARYLGISPQYLSDIKKERRTLGKAAAMRISHKTGIPVADMLFLNGADFVRKMLLAMILGNLSEPGT